jgi:hypothetical protein
MTSQPCLDKGEEYMNEEVQKKGMSTGGKWGVGCGVGCLTIIIIIAVVGFIGYKFVTGKMDDMTQDMSQLGFENTVKMQMIEVKDEITEPTLYIGQMVNIFGNCTTNLAIFAQMAEIHGRVDGKVYFRGQMLTIQPGAELRNGLDATAQIIYKNGKVDGEITGECQVIEDPAKK